jgi:hypothetical protein
MARNTIIDQVAAKIRCLISPRFTTWLKMSNMFVSKWRVNDGAKRADFGVLALAMCK